jgi:hypothetical protein
VQTILRWDPAAMAGDPATIIARGMGTGIAEYLAFGLEIRIVNAAGGIGELRWIWQDAAGVLRTQPGAHFQAADGFVLLTATRSWWSTTEVVVSYYLGDDLLGSYTSADGSIGGGTTALTSIGMRYTGADFDNFFPGAIDELRVVPRELQAEEVRATWKRIAETQPAAYTLVRELHDPGFPISEDPASDVQMETRMWGHALGYATAQADNMTNLLPDQAYGAALEQWERILKPAPAPRAGDSVEVRRRRVVAKFGQDGGVSIPALRLALEELAGLPGEDLQFIAFDETIRDDFAAEFSELRWTKTPTSSWGYNGLPLRPQISEPAGSFSFESRRFRRAHIALGGRGRGAQLVVQVTPVTLGNGWEMGIYVARPSGVGEAYFLGLRNLAGVYQVVRERFAGNASQGRVVLATLPGMPTDLWLRIDVGPEDVGDDYIRPHWSLTGATSGYSTAAVTFHPGPHDVGGMYLRTDEGASGSGAALGRFDDAIVRAPYGDRSKRFYVFRDPTLPGRLDKAAAIALLRSMKQSHTFASVITRRSLICDDPASIVDETPLGE